MQKTCRGTAKNLTYSNLPVSTLHLPYHGKRIFLKYYTQCLERCMTKKGATKVAWSAVKRKYYKKNGIWVAFADDNDFDTTTTNSDTE
ncbi:ChaB2 [Ectropis obliqua nucleopolyhedrovirus]|uniref:ChaB2 n=1 Tax=Ectropis obliqua nucleopolyhedrovirus TaxID=59376 RepID=A0EYU7_9ABAC|nr:ChaB2 [Ectropis obliqua nucleopolyhedrovirus]ABI35803.1 ChaB2 [Ectropis obliqua nucleopolyhedrovirus]QWV59687.1 ChaB2 [Ectropis obliqua nucleopolyhedrovirus]UYO72842.1 ChaB2 [Ectropis obliqua nucleopolyhedrovirus]